MARLGRQPSMLMALRLGVSPITDVPSGRLLLFIAVPRWNLLPV